MKCTVMHTVDLLRCKLQPVEMHRFTPAIQELRPPPTVASVFYAQTFRPFCCIPCRHGCCGAQSFCRFVCWWLAATVCRHSERRSFMDISHRARGWMGFNSRSVRVNAWIYICTFCSLASVTQAHQADTFRPRGQP